MNMQNALVTAFNSPDAYTDNGALTHSTSSDPVVDLFFIAGSSRGKDISKEFLTSWYTDPNLSFRLLQWLRDARGGAGERKQFIDLVKLLADQGLRGYNAAVSLVWMAPELGRWKDVREIADHPKLTATCIDLFTQGLSQKNQLAAKWCPRQGPFANKMRKHIGMKPKEYRQLLVGMTDVVESKMTSGLWDQIDFSKLPSLASARYQKAFGRHAPEQYSAYIESLQKGDAKINAGAVFPYDILKSINHGNSAVADEQWKAQPDYINGSKELILPMVDVSGSMECPAGGNKSLTCMDVAVSLGLYISERVQGPFHNTVLTFHESPSLFTLPDAPISVRNRMIRSAPWGMNTDFNKAFRVMLDRAVEHNVPADQMPTKILVLSDMEFDSACRKYYYGIPEVPTNFEAMDQLYAEHGYKRPQIVFWNLNARSGNVPVKSGEKDTALVSGFSPSLMTAILGADDMSPRKLMLDVLMNKKYVDLP